MVGCLMLGIEEWEQSNFNLQTPLSKVQIIELLILPDFPGCLCLHLKVDEKIPIWQMALNLESKNVPTGYGFGVTFSEAKSNACKIYSKRNSKTSSQIAINQ